MVSDTCRVVWYKYLAKIAPFVALAYPILQI
jgi:hypothetical protein